MNSGGDEVVEPMSDEDIAVSAREFSEFSGPQQETVMSFFENAARNAPHPLVRANLQRVVATCREMLRTGEK